jgi:peptidoglycan/xylan/chitin deacetylase (PgdA/CDA1 family)
MTRESRERVREELIGSRADLEERVNTNIVHIAYPSGLFDTNTVNAAAEAGYRFGFTGCMHRDTRHPLLTVPRVMLWEKACLDSRHGFSGPLLSCQVNRAFDPVSGCRQRHHAGTLV